MSTYRGRPWWGPRHERALERARGLAPVPFTLPTAPPVPLPLEFLRCPLPRILPDDNESVKAIRAIEAQIQTLKGRP